MTAHRSALAIISDQDKRAAVQAIIDYFASERDEEIGVIAAEDIINQFLEACGSAIYNQAIADAHAYYKHKLEEVNLDMEISLKK